MNEFQESLRRTIFVQCDEHLVSIHHIIVKIFTLIYKQISFLFQFDDDIIDYFEGLIYSFKKFYIVKFNSSEKYAETITKKELKIYGKMVKITAPITVSESETEFSKDLLVSPDEESPLNINNKLNDDCFEEIFKYLPLRDLCAAAEVCKKFQKYAQYAFEREFTNIKLIKFRENFEFMATNGNKLCYDFLGSINVIECLFRNFGLLIKSI